MAKPAYATLQEIRQEAGQQHLKENDSLIGTADGANAEFYTTKTVVVDSNQDDDVTVADITVYVNSVAVTVSSIEKVTGKVVLASAPAADATVEGRYYFSRLNDETIGLVRDEAEAWLEQRLGSNYNFDNLDGSSLSDVPANFRTACRLYAGGLLLIRDYGSSADTDLTSKDGYKKLEMAEKQIKQILSDLEDDTGTLVSNTSSVIRDGNPFPRKTSDDDLNFSQSDEDGFMRGS